MKISKNKKKKRNKKNDRKRQGRKMTKNIEKKKRKRTVMKNCTTFSIPKNYYIKLKKLYCYFLNLAYLCDLLLF